jgi:hypothetical protein
MSEPPVFPDLFHSFEVLTESGFESVGDQLGVGSVLPVVSSVQEPKRDSVPLGVRQDVLDGLAVLFGQLSSSEDITKELGNGKREKGGVWVKGNFCIKGN